MPKPKPEARVQALRAATKWAARPTPRPSAKQMPARTEPKQPPAQPSSAPAESDPEAAAAERAAAAYDQLDDAGFDRFVENMFDEGGANVEEEVIEVPEVLEVPDDPDDYESEDEGVQGDVTGSFDEYTAPIDRPLVRLDVQEWKMKGYIEMTGEKYYPVPQYVRKKLGKHLCDMLRHGKHGVTIDLAGRVFIDEIKEVLANDHIFYQYPFLNIMATMVLDDRYSVWSKLYEHLEDATHVSCNQGHTVKIDYDSCMTDLRSYDVNAHMMHATYYSYVARILNLGLLMGGGRTGGHSYHKIRPVHFHPYAHWGSRLDLGSRSNAEVAVYLNTDKVRRDVMNRIFKCYVSASGHIIVPYNLPPHYISHVNDVKNNLTIYSHRCRDKYLKKALAKAMEAGGFDPNDYSRKIEVLVAAAGLPDEKQQWVRMKTAPGNEGRVNPPNEVLWAELYLTREAGNTNSSDPCLQRPDFGGYIKCLRCQCHCPLGCFFCLNSRCGAPICTEGQGNLLATIKIETGGRDRYLEAIGFDDHRYGRCFTGRSRTRGKYYTAQNMKNRTHQAEKEGYRCHAERFDKSLEYMQMCMRMDIPRIIEVKETDPRNGKRTGNYIIWDQWYLDQHKWEESRVYAELLAYARNRASLLVRLPAHITQIDGEC